MIRTVKIQDYYAKNLYGKSHFGEYSVHITREDADMIFVKYGSKVMRQLMFS